MVVGNLNLRFVDRKTGEVREEGATRPEVILRQLATRQGQVCIENTLYQHRSNLVLLTSTWQYHPERIYALAGVQCEAGKDGH